ncbi:MAG: LL-diaminopimelate aminotransferase [Cyanobacteria bacterium]|nr:LL-diaminopimelate aminotransferase [Cyanobacteriota bacterium]
MVTEFLPAPASRLKKLPTYVFAELDEMKEAAHKRGADLIELGMGNPDLSTPKPIIEEIQKAVARPENHRYPLFKGKPAFREAVAAWMDRRYGVSIDPETEVQALIGSKEGLGHLTFAYIEPGDYSLVPSPYYPVHSRATWLAGGEVLHLPLTPENAFLPDLDSIPSEIAAKAKLFFVSYPNNPTTAIAPLSFYEKLVDYCKRHSIVLVSDLAYGEICFEGYRPPSIFNVPGAKSIAVEFHSFSKSFNMAGWRVGFAAGNPQVIKTLYSLKTNLDYGVASAIQDGAIYALNHGESFLDEINATYQQRRDVVINGFRSLGWTVEPTKGTLYVWLPIPERFENSKAWCKYLLDEVDVLITPGIAFGDAGDRFFRVSLVSDVPVLEKAIARLQAKGIRFQG